MQQEFGERRPDHGLFVGIHEPGCPAAVQGETYLGLGQAQRLGQVYMSPMSVAQ
jgi:hypothetical protein